MGPMTDEHDGCSRRSAGHAHSDRACLHGCYGLPPGGAQLGSASHWW